MGEVLTYLGWCYWCREQVVCDSPDTDQGKCEMCGDNSVYGPALRAQYPEIHNTPGEEESEPDDCA